jgi:hypothetical protein
LPGERKSLLSIQLSQERACKHHPARLSPSEATPAPRVRDSRKTKIKGVLAKTAEAARKSKEII